MTDWIIFAVYVAVLIPVWRRASWVLLHDVLAGDRPDTIDTVWNAEPVPF